MTRHDDYVPDRSRVGELAHFAAGHETVGWDDHGNAAPWPDDFFDPDAGQRPATTNPLAPAASEQHF